MRHWKYTIRFDHFWDREDIDIAKKGIMAAESIRLIKKYFEDDYDLDDIIFDFENISGDGEPEETTEFTITEDFDARMYDLYNWADANDVWVKTF